MNKLNLFLSIALSCLALSCGPNIKVVNPPNNTELPTPTTQEEPAPEKKRSIDWQDYDNGAVFKKAEETSNLVFLVFYSENCEYCEEYANVTLTDDCVVNESKDGFTFSMLNVLTPEGLEAYIKFTGVKPDENNKVEIVLPTTVIIATIKEVPDFNMVAGMVSGLVEPDVLCDTMPRLREAHRYAIKALLEELNDKKKDENSK